MSEWYIIVIANAIIHIICAWMQVEHVPLCYNLSISLQLCIKLHCLASLLLILQERLLQLFWEQKNEVWMLFDMDLWGKCIDLKLFCYCFNDKHERFKCVAVQAGYVYGESVVTCC